jgi:CNT family concentrative nucleoside transporter
MWQLRLVSFFGLFVMIFLAWLMSSNRRHQSPRIIVAGLLLQFGLAAVILHTRPGELLFDGINRFFVNVQNFVDVGSQFVFGMNSETQADSHTMQLVTSFAFGVMPTIIFISSLMSVLYYVGLMQRVVAAMGWVMQRTLGTSGAESLSTAANIFAGQTEAPLVIRPYLKGMTESELYAVMVGGFATIAGGVMAAYVKMGISAGHLLTASIISAPAALLISKVVIPETGQPETMGNVKVETPRVGANVIEAAAIGASDGMRLAINVVAMLIAFLALIAMADAMVGWTGRLFGFDGSSAWSLTRALGYAGAPLAWVMGIESRDCLAAGQLLGIKTAANEFVAYQQLADWIRQPDSPVHLQERTIEIMTYALCGFANFASIGIQIAGIGGMVPERQSELARLGLRAMLGGVLAGCMTGCVVGVIG